MAGNLTIWKEGGKFALRDNKTGKMLGNFTSLGQLRAYLNSNANYGPFNVDFWSGPDKIAEANTDDPKSFSDFLKVAESDAGPMQPGPTLTPSATPTPMPQPGGGGGEDDLSGLEGFDFGGLGGGGPAAPTAEELRSLAANALLAETQAGLLGPQFEYKKQADATALEQQKREALAATIASLLGTKTSELGSARSAAASTYSTAAPYITTQEQAALLGRLMPGVAGGQPVQTTRIPIDFASMAALTPEQRAAQLAEAEANARGSLGMAEGGLISGLYRAAEGDVATGVDTYNPNPVLQAQQLAYDELERLAVQYGSAGVPQAMIDAVMAYYNLPPGSVQLPPTLVEQGTAAAATRAAELDAEAKRQFDATLQQTGDLNAANIAAANLRAQAAEAGATTRTQLSVQAQKEIAQAGNLSAENIAKMTTSTQKEIAAKGLAETAREFNASLEETKRARLSEMYANPRRVIEAAYYQGGATPTEAARVMQQSIMPGAESFTGAAGATQGAGAGAAAPPPYTAAEGPPLEGPPKPKVKTGTAARRPTAAQRAASKAYQEAQAAKAATPRPPGTGMNQPGTPGYDPTYDAAGIAARQQEEATRSGYRSWADLQAAKTRPPGTAKGSVVSGGLAGAVENALLRRAAYGRGVGQPQTPEQQAAMNEATAQMRAGRAMPPRTPPRGPELYGRPLPRTPRGKTAYGWPTRVGPIGITNRPTPPRQIFTAAAYEVSGGNPPSLSPQDRIRRSVQEVGLEETKKNFAANAAITAAANPPVGSPPVPYNRASSMFRFARGGAVSKKPKFSRLALLRAARGSVVPGPAIVLAGEGKHGEGIKMGTHEYMLAAPGSVIAPGKKGETPTMATAIAAIMRQLRKSGARGRMSMDMMNGMARGGTVTAEKAKIILSEGSVRGHKLTGKQRGFFGARAGGAPLRRAYAGDITTVATPALNQAKRTALYDPLGGADPELRNLFSAGLPTYAQSNRMSRTQKGLLEAGLSAGRAEPEDFWERIRRDFEGFGATTQAGETARVGRAF